MIKTRIYRIGRLGCGALVLSLASQAAVAQTAYFSLEGDLNAAGDQYDFTFDLSRIVSSAETLFFETHTEDGGVNQAGDVIPSSSFDSNLLLFDGLNTQIAQADEIASPDFDALLSWAGVQTDPDGTPLPDPLGVDSYRLNLRDFGNDNTGPFAVDMVGPDDAMVFTGGTPVNTGTLNSLKFGSNDGGTAVYNHATGTFDLLGELVVAQTGSANLNLSSGIINAGGLTTINAGGTVTQTGGTLNADGGLTVDGGSYVRTSGTFNNPGVLTVQNGGLFEWNDANYTLAQVGTSVLVTGPGSVLRQTNSVGDSTVFVRNGVNMDVTLGGEIEAEYLFVESGSSVTVDGAGSTLDVTAGNTAGFIHLIGQTSGTSSLTLSNDASGTFASALPTSLSVGQSAAGTADVLSGADLTVQELQISPTTFAAPTGVVTVDGSGSTITQTAGSALDIGSASGSTGTLNVQNSGIFNASNSGTLNVNATGGLNVNAGGLFTATPAQTGNNQPGLAGPAMSSSGTINITDATLRLNGGNAGNNTGFLTIGKAGGAGGTLDLANGLVNLSGTATASLNGGRGARINAINTGGVGGSGGQVSVDGGALSLSDQATLSINGGQGGFKISVTGEDGGDGGAGGSFVVNGGTVDIDGNAALTLRGGNGGNGQTINVFISGDGGDGGTLSVMAGSLTLNGGLITTAGGAPGTAGTDGAPGAHGLIDVSGGTFEMNGGEAFTGSFTSSAGLFNHNDGKLTVSGGTFDPGSVNHTITSPALVELPTLVLTDGATAPAVTGTFIVGDSTRGRLELLNGATLASTDVRIGNLGGGSGQALVNGIGSTWTSAGGNAYVVGQNGTGELTVSDGGAVSTADFFVVGRGSTGDGTVHINSGGSVDATNPVRRMVIAEGGTGVVNVGAGGSLSSADRLDIGAFPSADGTLNVDGAGALVNANKDLDVAGNGSSSGGTGALNVSNSAAVNIGGSFLRNFAGGTIDVSTSGTINATPSPAASGVDGTNGKTLTTSGTVTIDNGAAFFNGGNGGGVSGVGSTGGNGGLGGTLNATGGSITLNNFGGLLFDGGDGGSNSCCDNFGGNGGNGGTLNLTNTNVVLGDSTDLTARGGWGGGGDTLGDGFGGTGGTINLSGGAITQNSTSNVILVGGRAGEGFFTPGNDGGAGGNLNLIGGAYTVNDNAWLALSGGEGTFEGDGGDGGNILMNGNGPFTINGGLVSISGGAGGNGFFSGDGGNGGTLTVNPGGPFTINGGTLDLLGGAGGTGTNPGADGAHGTIDIAGGFFSMFGGTIKTGTIDHTGGGVFNFNGGTLHVENFIGDLVENGGDLAPGFSAGKTTINGNYDQQSGSLLIELGGTAQSAEYDYVEVLGAAQLLGDLDVSLINGFTPTYGDSFQFLLAWNGVFDAFNLLTLPAGPANSAWSIFNDGNSLFLNLDSTLTGDLNNDGFVGIDDLNIVLGAWNQFVPPGNPLADPSGDGFVGIDDLNTVLGNWNAGTPPPPINTEAAIPEPGVLMLVCAGGLGLAMHRKRG